MNRKIVGWWFVTSATLVACGTTMYRPEYDIVLRDIRISPAPVPGARAHPVAPHSFRDDFTEGKWRLSRRDLDLDLRNISASPIHVRWDHASFVAVDGTRHPIALRTAPDTTPSALAPQARIDLALYPADYLVRENGKEVEWKSTPLIPNMPGVANSDLARVEAFARQQVGASFALELPVETALGRRVYHFVFEVTGATPVKVRAT